MEYTLRGILIMKRRQFFIFVFSLAFIFVLGTQEAGAQSFSLSPSTATQPAGEEFTVQLKIDTGGKEVTAADVKISFDSNVLQVTKVLEGTFFPEVTHNIYAGTLYVGGSFLQESQTSSGSGTLATLTLEGKTVGVGKLAFVCTTQNTDTNILDVTATDIVNCSANKEGTYTISAGLGGGSTSTASGTVTATPLAPVAGVTLPTFIFLGFGLLLTILGLAIIF
jgi:hypothetical protein